MKNVTKKEVNNTIYKSSFLPSYIVATVLKFAILHKMWYNNIDVGNELVKSSV